jgi:hypothetical protein
MIKHQPFQAARKGKDERSYGLIAYRNPVGIRQIELSDLGRGDGRRQPRRKLNELRVIYYETSLDLDTLGPLARQGAESRRHVCSCAPHINGRGQERRTNRE